MGAARLQPGDPGGPRRGPRGAQRRRQDDPAAPGGGPGVAHRRTLQRCSTACPPARRRPSSGSASSPKTRRSTPASRSPTRYASPATSTGAGTRSWARRRMAELGIPLDRKVGKLSGGQHAQVALVAVLAKRPELVVLDEPVARLDPLARHEFMAALMAAVAEEGLSVVFSSHVVAELERVCDYLIVLTAGQVQVAGEVDDLVAGHRLLVGPAAETQRVEDRYPVVRRTPGRTSGPRAGARERAPDRGPPPYGWVEQPVGLEELVLAYLREPAARALPGPAALGDDSWNEAGAVSFATIDARRAGPSRRPSRSAAASRHGAGWAGLTRVTWRQHRLALAAVAVLFGVFAAVLVVQGAGHAPRLRQLRPELQPPARRRSRGLAGRDLRERVSGVRHVRAAVSHVPAALHRRLSRRAAHRPRARERHLPLRLDPGGRAHAPDDRQARPPRPCADGYGAGLQRALLLVVSTLPAAASARCPKSRASSLRRACFSASRWAPSPGRAAPHRRGHCRSDGALVRRRAADRALPAPAFRGAADRARQHDLEVLDRVDAESVVGRPARPPSGQRRLQRPGAQPADQRPAVVAFRATTTCSGRPFSRRAASGPSRRSRPRAWSRSAWRWPARPCGGCAARRAESARLPRHAATGPTADRAR